MSEIVQEILKLIFVPAVIVAALTWLIRELFKSYLSMDVERYKSELQRDLEGFKAQLKAQYDISTVEFQTRFSLSPEKGRND
jgi:hypothetical protein